MTKDSKQTPKSILQKEIDKTNKIVDEIEQLILKILDKKCKTAYDKKLVMDKVREKIVDLYKNVRILY